MDDTGELALGYIDYAIFEVEKIRIKCNQYVINDCIYHLKKAKEALNEGLENPFDWVKFLTWMNQIYKNGPRKLPST